MSQPQFCKSLFSTILHIKQWYTFGSETSGDLHVGVAKFRISNAFFSDFRLYDDSDLKTYLLIRW